jgi:hypothetical protein
MNYRRNVESNLVNQLIGALALIPLILLVAIMLWS